MLIFCGFRFDNGFDLDGMKFWMDGGFNVDKNRLGSNFRAMARLSRSKCWKHSIVLL